jgi:3-phosphoshikimate 1-carboxyvinyltransferase
MPERARAHAMEPSGPLRGSIRVPGSKSHTNRAFVCAVLADGTSTLEGVLHSADTESMVGALRDLGFQVDVDWDAARAVVRGWGGVIPAAGARIDARDAGTVMRFLTAVVALGKGAFVMDGSPRMRERPIGDLIQALRALGVEARSVERAGYPPIEVLADGLAGGTVSVAAGVSSQYVSALLLASPCARSPVTLELTGSVVSAPFIELTVRVMSAFGAEVERPTESSIRVNAPGKYAPLEHEIEGDATAASYFWSAAAVTGGCVTVQNVGTASLQGDAAFPDVLERMGCRVTRAENAITVEGPEHLRGGTFDLNEMPDTAQTLAVVALFAEGPTEIVNVANLRVKECDRIAALAAELPKLGAAVEERASGLVIRPPAGGRSGLRGASIATYDDHRMAMSFAVAGLAIEGVVIENPRCIDKTYPGFFADLQRLQQPG